MGLTLVAAPADTPVSLDVAKQQVNVTGVARDELLTIYLAGAVDAVEKFLGRALIDQTWDQVLDAFPADGVAIEILRPPLIELVGLFYTDDAGDEQEVDAADLVVDGSALLAKVTPLSGSWPTPRDTAAAVRIRFRGGYLDTGVSPAVANVPAAIKIGVLLMVGDLYAHRETFVVGETAVELPGYLQEYLYPYRVNLGLA